MHVRLKTVNGEDFTIEVFRESQVLQFRRDVAIKLNVEYERIRLIFAGQVLNDAEAINKYEIFDGSVVHAVVRPVNSVPSAASVTNGATIPSRITNSEANSTTPYFHLFPCPLEMSAEEARSQNIPEMGFGNGVRMMMGPMAVSMGDVNAGGHVGGGGGASSASIGHPSSIGMDTLFPNMPMGSHAGATNPRSRTQNSRTVLKAKEPHFGNTIESGLSSIRCIKYDGDNSTYYNSNNVNHDIEYEDIDPRLDDPSMAVAQMLSELGTCLKGLQVPLLNMSEKMQTGEFIQCTTSTQRISRQSEISNMKVTLQNLAVAAQQAARSLVLLTVEVVPGVQAPLRPSVPFAAAAAAARAISTAREGPVGQRKNTNPAVLPTVAVTAAGTKSEPVAKTATTGSAFQSDAPASNKSAPGQSMKLAKGFLNRPSTKMQPRPIVSKIPEIKDSSAPIVIPSPSHPMGGATHDSDSCPKWHAEISDSDNCQTRKKAATTVTATSAVNQSTSTSATGSAAGKTAAEASKIGCAKPTNNTPPSGRPTPSSASSSSSSHCPNGPGSFPTPVCPIFAAEAMSWYFGGRDGNGDDDDDDDDSDRDSENARRMREMYFYQMTNDPEFREMMRINGQRLREESDEEEARQKAAKIKEASKKKAAALKLAASKEKEKEKEKELMLSSTAVTNIPLSSSCCSSSSSSAVPVAVAASASPILGQDMGPILLDCGPKLVTKEEGTSLDVKSAATLIEPAMTETIAKMTSDEGITQSTLSSASSFSYVSPPAPTTRFANKTPINWSPRCGGARQSLTGKSNINPLIRRKYNATKAMPTVPLRPLMSSLSPLIIPMSSDSSGVNIVKSESIP